jgi:hypothetical protein
MLDDNQKWYRVSLRFLGDDLDIAAVTRALGLKPDVVGRIGEHIGGNPRCATYDTNVWVYRYTDDDGLTFNEQLSGFITRLEGRGDSVRELAARPSVTAELFLGFSSGNGQAGSRFGLRSLPVSSTSARCDVGPLSSDGRRGVSSRALTRTAANLTVERTRFARRSP